jgi:RNA polymerase sigma factor (sigma-70 family)
LEREASLGSNGVCFADKTTDELLSEFQNGGGQLAFEEIVRRYAGMVYTVCLQVTRDVHDAEDATQAAFLTLALRAKTAESNIKFLGPWLQKVARRLSLDIMRAKKRRKTREEKRGAMVRELQPDRDPRRSLDRGEMADIVRDELSKLPAKYRLPLILHYFGGLRPEEVARELGFKPSTLGVRLHRGRKMLADSLAGRGITLTNGMLATILAGVVHIGVSDNVVASTSLAAAGISSNGEFVGSIISSRVLALTRQAMNAMLWAKAKAVFAALLLTTVALAGTAQAIRTLAPEGLSWRMLDVTRLVRPLLRTLLGRPQFSAAPQPAVAADPLPAPGVASIDWPPDPARHVRGEPALEAWGAGGAFEPLARSQRAPGIEVDEDLATSSGSASISLALAGAQTTAPLAPASAPLTSSAFAAAPVQFAPVNVLPAVGFRLDYTNRAIYHTAGRQQFDSLVLDSRSSAFTNYVMDGPAVLDAKQLVVGDVERGSFDQRGGVVNAQALTLGNRHGSTGEWRLARGAQLAVAGTQTVGLAGAARFVNNGGVNVTPTLHIARDRGSRGLYQINDDGSLISDNINVGMSGIGELINNGGNVSVASSKHGPGVISIGTDRDGDGHVVLNGGSITVDSLIVAEAGRGRWTQTDGTLFAKEIQVGQLPTSHGYASFGGGQVVLKPSGNVVVGGEGVASVTLGDRRGTTTFSEAQGKGGANSGAGGASIVVRNRSTAAGQIRGWGRIDVTGPFTQNGLVIADGFGKSRHLDFSSAAHVTNTIDNSERGGRNGWLATRGGKLVLPPIYVEGDRTSTWGEDPLDPIPDLINSVRFTVRGVRQPGEAILSLIAPDSPLLPDLPDGETFIGLWGFDRNGLAFDDADLQVRYDELLVHERGGDESALRLWTFADDWSMVPAGHTHIDTTLNLLAGSIGRGDFRVFGVSLADGLLPVPSFADAALDNPALATSAPIAIPEPGAAGALLVTACGALLRRQRR